jgi:predicted Zn-ribbon and HTH transcriptional regulator
MSTDKHRNSADEERLRIEQGDMGIWFLCPHCMSQNVWQISYTLKNVKAQLQQRQDEIQSLVGSLCQDCGYKEIDNEAIKLGFDKLNRDEVRKMIK